VQELFERMAAGEFSPALVDAETRWRYLRNTGAIGELAKKLFGEPSEDRAAVIADYMKCLELPGDVVRGQAVFAQVCTACHKMGELGADVGPSLADVKVKPPEALLSDILDPNRMFEARWSAYQADMKDGRMLSGLLENETSEAVTLKLMGGALMTLPRAELKQLKAMDRSLMPPGLEAGIDAQQMADLLAYLLGK
jgi:putative heme-binding domain-containing protein